MIQESVRYALRCHVCGFARSVKIILESLLAIMAQGIRYVRYVRDIKERRGYNER
jgi:hypothetical protein